MVSGNKNITFVKLFIVYLMKSSKFFAVFTVAVVLLSALQYHWLYNNLSLHCFWN